MTNEIHPVVELLIARMESHPEEFRDDYLMSEVRATVGSGRWFRVIHAIRDHGSEQDNAALSARLRDIRMQQIHEWTMDELLNGEDRRREEEERKKQLWQQQQQMHQQAYQQSPHLQAGTQNLSQLGGYQQLGLLGAASSIPAQLQLGKETLSESMIQQIRKKLSI
jgi:RNA-binding protein YhbY